MSLTPVLAYTCTHDSSPKQLRAVRAVHGGGPPTLACGSHSFTSHRATYGQPDHGVNGTNDRANGKRAIAWIRRRPIIVNGTDNRHYRVKGRDNGFMRCCDHRVSYRPGLLRAGVEAKVGALAAGGAADSIIPQIDFGH